ncbi:hypothetical protein CEXT_50531 [Caerostris extrusa]|uniref:Uncharacterized protein n=1 Tax=Caerostris extrusa TaxID=172846 RepID=A0AAV4MI57_CAEEX|nr:hypothetical protein CEXT_50531 [Caerostris extrusa]
MVKVWIGWRYSVDCEYANITEQSNPLQRSSPALLSGSREKRVKVHQQACASSQLRDSFSAIPYSTKEKKVGELSITHVLITRRSGKNQIVMGEPLGMSLEGDHNYFGE